MKIKSLYFIFIFLIIPIYIFGIPLKNYINNFDKLTYSLEIPKNIIDEEKNLANSYMDIEISDDIKLEKRITESWIIMFPDLANSETKDTFISQLKQMGILSVIHLNSTSNKILSVGPFVDKKIAELISTKINKRLGQAGTIKRFND